MSSIVVLFPPVIVATYLSMRSIVLAVCVALCTAAPTVIYPATYLIVEDDYPYQCLCQCDGPARLSTCEFDKRTVCYCDVPPNATLTTH